MTRTRPRGRGAALPPRKAPTGVAGLDEVLGGGLPVGRATLVSGGPGCGKTVLGTEFLVRGARAHDERGLFVSFEERIEDLYRNVAAFGWGLEGLVAEGRIALESIDVQPTPASAVGRFDLSGLFVRLEAAIDAVGATRLVLDTLGTLLVGFGDGLLVRAEIARLLAWLRGKGVTTLITSERTQGGEGAAAFEEHLVDCVIHLEHRLEEQLSTRFLRVMKYRGSEHMSDEFPFLIGAEGLVVYPISSLSLDYEAGDERVSSGVRELDAMLGGEGFFRGSSVLVSGQAGAGKTSFAAHFVDHACREGRRAFFLSLEESPAQLVRNLRSIGLDLERWRRRGLLEMRATRVSQYGLERHLAELHALIERARPEVGVIDRIGALRGSGGPDQAWAAAIRVIDHLKRRGVTLMMTDLVLDGREQYSEIGISSAIDTWLVVRELESGGERNRTLYIVKSRGMAHSDQVREFALTGEGIRFVDAYTGPGGALTGSARAQREAEDRRAAAARASRIEGLRRELDWRRRKLEAELELLRADYERERSELERSLDEAEQDEIRHASEQDARRARRTKRSRRGGGGTR